MYLIKRKSELNPTVTIMDIYAPEIAAKAQAGQFVIIRADENGERIPLTIAEYDAVNGTVTVIFQIVGVSTGKLNSLNQGEYISDIAGPLGKATQIDGIKRVAVVGGGVGCAIAYPVAKAFAASGTEVTSIVGFRSSELVILENEFKKVSGKYLLMTDDGSAGQKGIVTDALRALLDAGERFDRVIVIGPLVMMKYVALLTKQYGVPTVASMNPIMVDGTGMCGGCRLTVGGKVKFACVDGPEFDAHQIDFDEAINRSGMYKAHEQGLREKHCNLFKK